MSNENDGAPDVEKAAHVEKVADVDAGDVTDTDTDADTDSDTAKPTKADKLIARAEKLREREAARETARQAAVAARAAGRPVPATSGGWRTASIVQAVVIVLLVAALVVVTVQWRSDSSDNDHLHDLAVARTDSLNTAKTWAVRFGSYDYQHLDADFTATTKTMTPSFASKYKSTSEALTKTFVAYKTQVTATVSKAAVVSASTGKAQVLVLLDQVVKSTQSTTPKINRNRLLISLVRTKGTWLVDRTDAT